MRDCKKLLIHHSEETSYSVSEQVDDRHTSPLGAECEQGERRHASHKARISVVRAATRGKRQPHSVTTSVNALLAQYVSPAVLEVFPEWEGILIEFSGLMEAVWIVRDSQSGRMLARETGHPVIHMNEITAQEGQTIEEIVKVLLARRKTVKGNEGKRLKHKMNTPKPEA